MVFSCRNISVVNLVRCFSLISTFSLIDIFILASFPLHTGQTEASRLPDAADLRKMCIITKSDLNRIQENLNRRQREKDAIQNEIQRKQELAARSAQITKNWPNTIAVIVLTTIKFDRVFLVRIGCT